MRRKLPGNSVRQIQHRKSRHAGVWISHSGSAAEGTTMSHVMHRSGASDLPEAVAGDGCYLIDRTGKRYLDASGGAAVSCLGHSHPAVIAAVQEQIGRMAYAHTSFFTNRPMEELADRLIADAPPGVDQ